MNVTNSPFFGVLRKSAMWLLLAVVVAFAIYRVIFAPVHVLVHEVKNGPIIAEVMGTGTLEARIKTTISPQIQERLAEVLVDQNDPVKAGQLLARLDDGELKGQVEVAEATVAAAKSTAERVLADEARAQAVEVQAQQDHKRVSELVSTKVSSQSEFDKAIELLRVAEADLQRARAATVEARQQIITAEKNLAYQQERLSFTRILSPYDGLVTRRDRDAGGVVVPGSSILQIISTNEIWVSAWVDETASAGLATGQTARVVFRSESEKNHPGAVKRLGRETDRETREFLVDVAVNNLPANWTVGQRAEVFIETGRKTDALVVPQQFIQWRAGKPGVFVPEKGHAAWRDVSLGLRGSETVEITRGLSAGEKVVALLDSRQTSLKPGQKVALQ
jgi:HlyD family secretion protein